MTLLKHVGRISVAGACLFAVMLATSSEVSARPTYKSAFEKAFPELAKKHGKNNKLTCAVCHPVKDKKKRNDYGVAMTKALGKKNEKDKDKLKEALKKTGEMKNKDGKTYAELIKDGKLPGGKDAAN